MPESSRSLERALDELYAAPLADFIPARKTLAARLKREGHAVDSDRVAHVAKPAAPAWALNQVFWHAREAWDALVAAGDRLRALQQRMLAGRAADPRDAIQDRQRAVQAVVDRAMEYIAEAGHAASDATRQRIAVSADAIAAYGSHPQGYTPGRLVEDVAAPGFAALASLGAPSLRLVTSRKDTPAGRGTTGEPAHRASGARGGTKAAAARDRDAEARAAEQRRRAEREAAARQREARREAEKAAADAERALRTARHAEMTAGSAVAERRRAIEAQRTALAELERDLEQRTRAADEARQARETAEAAAARAREALAELRR